MKLFLYLLLFLILAGLWLLPNQTQAQNVGIGEPAPQEKLDVSGNLRSQGSISMDPVSAAAANAISVSVNRSVLIITATAGVQTNAVTLTGTPRSGQIFYILNLDDNAGTFNGNAVPAGSIVSGFINQNGTAAGWRPYAGNDQTGDWKILGNAGTNPTNNYIGTSDNQELSIRTNGTERIRVETDGDVGIGTNNPDFRLEVQGGNMEIENDNADSYLRFHDPNNVWYSVGVDQSDATKFKINAGATPGANDHVTMTAGGFVGIGTAAPGARLEVRAAGNSNPAANGVYVYNPDNAAPADDDDAIVAIRVNGDNAGDPFLSFDISGVNGWSIGMDNSDAERLKFGNSWSDPATNTRMTLETGGDVGIGVTDPEFRFDVRNGTTSHVMNVVNTTNNGDGIRIKLNGTHPRWNGTAYASMPTNAFNPLSGALTAMQNLIQGGGAFNPLSLMPSLGLTTLAANAMCSLSNQVTNLMLGSAAFTSITLSYPCGLDYGIDLDIDTSPSADLDISFNWCSFDPFPNSVNFGCPSYNVGNFTFLLPTWNVTNTLSTNHEFLTFVDSGDRWCGAVSGQSIANWTADQLSTCNLLELIGGFASIDPLDLMVSASTTLVCYSESYNSIGVVYQSGNADYAEWLKRANNNEKLTPGDIVGVRMGLISKNIEGAEQVMVVSTNPIMVGNAPNDADKHLGNNVAFMGQVPVKIVGPVTTGDYILANGPLPGYGRAVAPAALTEKDMTLCVGRAWETKDAPGPKMVNTVIGVDNGGWKNVLLKMRQDIGVLQQSLSSRTAREEETDRRLQELEAQLHTLLDASVRNGSRPAPQNAATTAQR